MSTSPLPPTTSSNPPTPPPPPATLPLPPTSCSSPLPSQVTQPVRRLSQASSSHTPRSSVVESFRSSSIHSTPSFDSRFPTRKEDPTPEELDWYGPERLPRVRFGMYFKTFPMRGWFDGLAWSDEHEPLPGEEVRHVRVPPPTTPAEQISSRMRLDLLARLGFIFDLIAKSYFSASGEGTPQQWGRIWKMALRSEKDLGREPVLLTFRSFAITLRASESLPFEVLEQIKNLIDTYEASRQERMGKTTTHFQSLFSTLATIGAFGGPISFSLLFPSGSDQFVPLLSWASCCFFSALVLSTSSQIAVLGILDEGISYRLFYTPKFSPSHEFLGSGFFSDAVAVETLARLCTVFDLAGVALLAITMIKFLDVDGRAPGALILVAVLGATLLFKLHILLLSLPFTLWWQSFRWMFGPIIRYYLRYQYKKQARAAEKMYAATSYSA